MTAYADCTSAIRQRLAAGWTDTTIIYPNNKKTLPTTDYIELNILWADSQQMSIGAPSDRLFRARGLISIQIITQADTGDGLGLQRADTLAALFRDVDFSGVTTFAPYPAFSQPDEKGTRWVTILQIPFSYDRNF